MALILASTSPIRRAMLDSAGVAYQARAPSVDETAVKARSSDPEAIVRSLAEAKALNVSMNHSDDLVIGSDSIVSVGGRLFDKPKNRGEALEHLRFFSEKPMQLTSGVVLARAGEIAWTHVDTATLQVRRLSGDFIDWYLDAEWPEVSYCVGVFRMEGRGVQLFERIDGNHFTILGMPLIPLLGALRVRGVLLA